MSKSRYRYVDGIRLVPVAILSAVLGLVLGTAIGVAMAQLPSTLAPTQS